MTYEERSTAYKKKFYEKNKQKEEKIEKIKLKTISAQTGSQAEFQKLISELKDEYSELRVLWSYYLAEDIPLSYRMATLDVIDKLRNNKTTRSILRDKVTKIEELLNSNIHRGTIKALLQDAMLTSLTAINNGEKSNVSTMRKIQQQMLLQKVAIAEGLAETGTIKGVTNKILENLQDQLLANGTIKAGSKNYDAKKYAEMVSRTETRKAQTQATINTATQYGTDLVQISSHNTTTPICIPYEGKIFSISGKDKDFPMLDQTTPFHPNCQHVTTVVFREYLEVMGIQKYIDFANGNSETHPTRTGHIPISERDNVDQDKVSKAVKDFEKRTT